MVSSVSQLTKSVTFLLYEAGLLNLSEVYFSCWQQCSNCKRGNRKRDLANRACSSIKVNDAEIFKTYNSLLID